MKYYSLNFISGLEYKYRNSIKEVYYSGNFVDRHDKIHAKKKMFNKSCIAYNHSYFGDKKVYVNFEERGAFSNKRSAAHYTYDKYGVEKQFYLKGEFYSDFKSNEEWRQYCRLLVFL